MSSNRFSSRAATRRLIPNGFSLVEVVISLGVVAFAFVGLLGLIPLGLSSLDTAIDATVESQILQHVATMARQANFTALKTDHLNVNPGQDPQYPNRPLADYYFTEQGELIVGDLATQQKNYVYSAAVYSVAGLSLPTGDQAGGNYLNPQLATVRVLITRRSAPAKLRAYSLYVPNNGLGQ
jgi:uncharacterized protein (TIGR02598 family)